eukprot:599501-Prorocentrum_minimum.AAC.1
MYFVPWLSARQRVPKSETGPGLGRATCCHSIPVGHCAPVMRGSFKLQLDALRMPHTPSRRPLDPL